MDPKDRVNPILFFSSNAPRSALQYPQHLLTSVISPQTGMSPSSFSPLSSLSSGSPVSSFIVPLPSKISRWPKNYCAESQLTLLAIFLRLSDAKYHCQHIMMPGADGRRLLRLSATKYLMEEGLHHPSGLTLPVVYP